MFKVNEKTSELITLQRTGYGSKPADMESVAAAYFNDMSAAYADISKHIPASCESVLDIGCGIGGIDVLIGKDHPECGFSMLDRDGMESTVYYGFKAEGAKYNYLSSTKEFMVDNGIDADKIYTYNVDAGEFPFDKKFNVIISLISWGFHYPVSTYVNRVADMMDKKSILIIDIRHGSGGYEQLLAAFSHVAVIHRYSKCNRLIVKK